MEERKKKTMLDVAKEIYKTFNQLIIFYGFLRFGVIFLFVFLILSFFKLSWYLALIPAIIYFIYYSVKKSKFNKVKIIESHYEDLNEKLSTAIDNPDDSNYFVFSLHKDVKKALKGVDTGTFFNFKRAMQDLGTVAILSILIIFIAQFNFTIARFDTLESSIFNITKSTIDDLAKQMTGKESATSSGDEGTGGKGEFSDIFGDKSIVELGDKEVELQINPSEHEIDINEQKDEDELTFESIFPDEIGGEAATSFEERIPKEQQEIVKQYYKNIAGN